jgi:hypothetical protein
MPDLAAILRKGLVAAALIAAVVVFHVAVFAATGQAPAALVLFPSGGPSNLPDGVTVLRWEDNYAVVTDDHPNYVRGLYANGALLVLPFRRSGCLSIARQDGDLSRE